MRSRVCIGSSVFCFVFMACGRVDEPSPVTEEDANVIGGRRTPAIPASSPCMRSSRDSDAAFSLHRIGDRSDRDPDGRALRFAVGDRPGRHVHGIDQRQHQSRRRAAAGRARGARQPALEHAQPGGRARPGHRDPRRADVIAGAAVQSPGAGGPIGGQAPAHRRLWPQRRSATDRRGRQAPGLDQAAINRGDADWRGRQPPRGPATAIRAVRHS